jgi:hypothetical protein
VRNGQEFFDIELARPRIAIHESAHAVIGITQGLGIQVVQLSEKPAALMNYSSIASLDKQLIKERGFFSRASARTGGSIWSIATGVTRVSILRARNNSYVGKRAGTA